jgi:hypothetical protein
MIERDMLDAMRKKLKANYLPKNLENENARKRAQTMIAQAARERDLKNRLQRSEQAYRDIASRAIQDFCATYVPEEQMGSRFGVGNKV